MKNGFTRMETRAAGSGARVMGKRTLAIVLFFVMLITAIGSGSGLSAVAVAFEGSGAGVLAQAAKAGAEAADVTLSDDTPAAADSSDTSEPFVDDIEDGFVVSKKADSDAADTGRDADLAASGWGVQSSKIIYFVNTDAYTDVRMHFWGKRSDNTDWNNYETMTRIGFSGIYKYKPSSDYTANGFNFCEGNDGTPHSKEYYDWVTTDKTYWLTSAADGCAVNGTAKVISMIKDEDTGRYGKAANADCVATISGTNISDGETSSSSGSTGASDTAECYPAYSTTVSYSASDSGIYHFDGFSTTSSTSLPASHPTTMEQISYYYGGYKTNVPTVYAYFSKVKYEAATPATASRVASGTVLMWGHDDSFYTNCRTWVFGTGVSTSENVGMASIGSIHKIDNSMITKGDPITTSYAPNVYLTTGTTTDVDTWPGGSQWNIYSPTDANPTYTLSNSDAVYYNDSTNTKWNIFAHLAATAPTLKYNNNTVTEVDAVDSEVTVSTILSGTLSDGNATVDFYFTKDGVTKKITGDVTESSKTYSIKFYPPEYGSYTIMAVAKDSKNVETVHTSTSSLAVGEGFYVEGDSGLVAGGGWGTHFAVKGAMKQTASGSKLWRVVYPSVASGMHEFRITSLTQAGAYVTDKDNVTVTGNASAAVVNGTGEDKNNIRFELAGKSRVTITFNETKSGDKYPVTVDVAEVVGMPVTVYANTGGTVTATYGSTTYDVAEGGKNSFTVGEGEVIDLAATPKEGYEFDHWTKNLTRSYEIGGTKAGASLTNEAINTKTVYVAAFKKSGSSTHPSTTDGMIEYTGSSYFGHLGPGDNLKDQGTNYNNLKLYTKDDKFYAYIKVDDDTEVLNKSQSNDTQIKTGKSYYFGLSSSNSANDLFFKGDGKSVTVSKDSAADTTYIDSVAEQEWGGSHIGRFYMKDAAKGGYVRLELGSTTTSATDNSGTYKVKYISVDGGSVEEDVVFDPIMNFYAKDSSFSGQSTDKLTYLGTLDTTVTNVEGSVQVDSVASSGKNFECGLALKGSTITVSTTIPHTGSLTALKADGTTETVCADDKYYVAGFSFNGVTPEILSEQDGREGGTTYTCSYQVPDNLEGGMLEITPIFFVKEKYASNCATFYINGYEHMLQSGGSNWGNTLYIYPFYKRYKNNNNDKTGGDTTYAGKAENFGAYPGQPVINNGGQLYTQIPLTCNATIDGIDTYGNPIKGVTINNGYFDGCHKNYCSFVSEHQQTYDYDDFQKIVKEKSTQNGSKYLHSVYFSFKYYSEDETHQHRSYTTTSKADSDTRYNDMMADGYPGATTTLSTLRSKVENASNKFEYLTDALGNPVDLFGNPVTVADKTVDPSGEALWVVSLGYEFNNSGQYATEWAVYHTADGINLTLVNTGDSATGTNSSIVPSALIMNGSSSFSNYNAMDGDQAISGYQDLYTALAAYKNKPVMICYEYDAFINYNSPHAYRSDGRWSYTTVNDYVASDIKIQYSTDSKAVNDPTKVWADDTFISSTNQGTTTKARAYFTNSAYYGLTASTSQIISNSEADNYKFTAEPSGSYVFAGWYLQDAHGKISKITNESTSAETRRSGNFTMIARFQYVNSGSLVISHVLDADSTGRGTTYLGVTLNNGSEDITLANSASNTNAVTIDENYIKNTSTFTITIELRTVANGENTFNGYDCYVTNASDVVNQESSNTAYYTSANSALSTSTYSDISIQTVIYGGDETQDIKGIEYVSKLTPVHYNYNIKYQFESRKYGNMQYTQSGSLSAGEIGDEKIVTKSGADRILSKSFLASKAPYESNFMKDINWNFDYSGITQTTTYTEETNTYTIDVLVPLAAEADTPQNPTRNAYITVPYALAADKTGVAAIVGDTASGYVNKVTVGESPEEVPLTFTISKPYDSYVKDSDNKTLTAPVTLLASNSAEASVEKYFQYWEVKDHDSTRENRVLFKCYFPSFNYRLVGDYDIKAVYGNDPNNTYSTIYKAESETDSTSVVFIGNSRNQWNGGINIDDGMNASAPKTEGDIVYNDFILSFNPKGDDLIKDIAGAEYGMVIQKLDAVSIDSKTKKNLHNLLWYEEQNTSTEAAARTAAEKLVNGTPQLGYSIKRLSTTSNQANDKNRMHYAYSAYNNFNEGEKSYDTMKNCKFLYRAFSYMMINGTVTISENPAYFYMYDEAIK